MLRDGRVGNCDEIDAESARIVGGCAAAYNFS